MFSAVIADGGRADIARTENYIRASGLPLAVTGRFEDGLSLGAFLRENPPDIVIADIRLPGPSALSVLRKAGERPEQCLFIAVSTFDEFTYDHVRAALEAGAVSYLLKPVNPEMLIDTLTKAVERLSREGNSAGRPQGVGAESAELAERIYRHILEHYAEPLSIADVKAKFAVSESYIHKLLIRHRGESFVRILTKVRMNEADRMMRKYPDMPIQDVACAVGYGDPHYFSRIYKAVTGSAPSESRGRRDIEVDGHAKR